MFFIVEKGLSEYKKFYTKKKKMFQKLFFVEKNKTFLLLRKAASGNIKIYIYFFFVFFKECRRVCVKLMIWVRGRELVM